MTISYCNSCGKSLDKDNIDAVRIQVNVIKVAEMLVEELKEWNAKIEALEADKERLDWLETLGSFIELDNGRETYWGRGLGTLRETIDQARATISKKEDSK